MQNKKKRYILKINRLDADGKVLNLHQAEILKKSAVFYRFLWDYF